MKTKRQIETENNTTHVWTAPSAPPASRASASAVLMTLKLPQKFQLEVLQTQHQLTVLQQGLEVSNLDIWVIYIFYL